MRFEVQRARGRLLIKKFEVSLAGHPGSSQIVLDDEYRNCGVFRNHEGPQDTDLRVHHVIAFGAHPAKPIGFEHSDELFVGDWAKLWHV